MSSLDQANRGEKLVWFGETERKLAKLSMTTFTYHSSCYLFYEQWSVLTATFALLSSLCRFLSLLVGLCSDISCYPLLPLNGVEWICSNYPETNSCTLPLFCFLSEVFPLLIQLIRRFKILNLPPPPHPFCVRKLENRSCGIFATFKMPIMTCGFVPGPGQLGILQHWKAIQCIFHYTVLYVLGFLLWFIFGYQDYRFCSSYGLKGTLSRDQPSTVNKVISTFRMCVDDFQNYGCDI